MQIPSLVMAIASFLNIFMPISVAIDPQCDFYQELVMGQEYYIYNKEYPEFYPSSTSCRWVGKSPEGTNIVLSCENIELPESPNCDGDRLAISLTGNENFKDAINYCGHTGLTLISETNAIAVGNTMTAFYLYPNKIYNYHCAERDCKFGLFALTNSPGGRFVCALTAIQVGPTPTTTKRPDTCDCGWKHETRIIGGHDTGINEYPSMAALIDGSTRDLFCGASIISDQYALTAAHCFHNQQPSNVGLLVGDFNLTSGTDTAAAALYAISEFKKHPYFDMNTFQNDVGVVKTKVKMQFSVLVGPICLPFKYTIDDFYAQTVTALGWGFTDFSGPKSDTLKEVDLSVVSNRECAAAISANPISANQLCTYAPMKDACLSDSGGPILWRDANTRRLQLVGIISYGLGCATSKPGVNTRVTSYLSWIASVTRDAVYCIK